MDVSESELCDYLQVRHAKLDPVPSEKTADKQQKQQPPTVPSKLYKHWTSLWVVLHVEISPNYSYIGYCKKESDWLSDSQTIAKCYLDETFKVERLPPGYSKKYDNVLQLTFKGYRLDLGFDSMTKLDSWFKALLVTSERHHVDLVRCHEHPQLEGEYVIQVSSSSYLIWNPRVRPVLRPSWEWHLKHIRRVHWHKNVNKLEVEPGRSSDTGEGHFYFTGQHAYRLFRAMKHMMSTHSQVSPSNPGGSAPPVPLMSELDPGYGLVRVKGNGSVGGETKDSGSESDWTGGTGDDWTGASSDSAFINYIRSQHQNSRFNSSPGAPSPPLQRRSNTSSPQQSEEVYMNLNPNTLNQDNQYCTINQIRPKGHSPTPTNKPGLSSPLQSVLELSESLDEDDYCKMVSNAGIRAGLKQQQQQATLSPVLLHRQIQSTLHQQQQQQQSPLHRQQPVAVSSPLHHQQDGSVIPSPLKVKGNSVDSPRHLQLQQQQQQHPLTHPQVRDYSIPVEQRNGMSFSTPPHIRATSPMVTKRHMSSSDIKLQS